MSLWSDFYGTTVPKGCFPQYKFREKMPRILVFRKLLCRRNTLSASVYFQRSKMTLTMSAGLNSVFYARAMANNASALADQYAKGNVAKVWNSLIGDQKNRTKHYRERLVALLRAKGCRKILDVATGTGVDSIMLCEEGFQVTSIDASDKMLKEALKVRWERRKEAAFDAWVIDEANWLTMGNNVNLEEKFDALICLGNSFAHMPDFHGDKMIQRLALQNFEKCIKPGGLLIIDHRNYDHFLDVGTLPSKCIYYDSESDCENEVDTSILYVDGSPKLVTVDYLVKPMTNNNNVDEEKYSDFENEYHLKEIRTNMNTAVSKFHLSWYPHRYQQFSEMLKEVFGTKAKHSVFGDYKKLTDMAENDPPGFYIHIVEKCF